MDRMSIGAGRLNKQITIIRAVETVADSGAVSTAWGELLKVRAEAVENAVTEEQEGFGEHEAGPMLFRIRFDARISTADRVIYGDALFGVDELVPFNRDRWLEIRATMISREIPPHDAVLPPTPDIGDGECCDDALVVASTQW